MRILMTGGTGFIGRSFIKRYPVNQYTVLSRSPDIAKGILPREVNIVSSLSEISTDENFDVVINLAGEPIADKRWSVSQKAKICESRWNITRDIVAFIQTRSVAPQVFISGSAVGVYGDTGYATVDESKAAMTKDFAVDLCEEWERLALQLESSTRVVLL